jgi:HSP20 family protein
MPGLYQDDFQIVVGDDARVVSGEKRCERDSSDGRWRTIQCAYGAFRRVGPLPALAWADQAKAGYRNGVLRVELPKVEPGPVHSVTIDVQ